MAGQMPGLVMSGSDPWAVTPEERIKFNEQFMQLMPVQGIVTGEQAKRFFLQSQLPPVVLGQIWSLADVNADGKMDTNEFAIAMKLVQLKLKGFEVPKVLPQSLRTIVMQPVAGATFPSTIVGPSGITGVRPLVQAGIISPMPAAATSAFPPSSHFGFANGAGFTTATSSSASASGVVQVLPPNISSVRPASPIDVKMQRSSSVTSQESPTGSVGSPLQEWAIPNQSRLKYTQLFNTHDRMRTGHLTGPQARNILVQTGLPQPVLAQIWALADLDGDGRLTCEEFCVALHLSDCVKAGDKLPTSLPSDLIPPSFRKRRTSSVTVAVGPSVSGVVSSSGTAAVTSTSTVPDLLTDPKEEEKVNVTTFEDKRRENFEKGQAELERRRQALLESQRKEQEERERKEREEQERRERIRQEQERRRQQELEKQLAKQREMEQEKEDQRRKALEQREAARREMERQRQLEWEKQRRQELLSQRQKEQEKVLQLKAQNQTLCIELEQLNEKVKDLNRKIVETRNGVAEIKGAIDEMRESRDSKITEMDGLKKQIKDQNQKLILLNQEKLGLSEQVKINSVNNPTADSFNVVMHSFGNRQIAIKTLKDRLTNVEDDISQKLLDIETNNTQLANLKTQISTLVSDTEEVFRSYEERRKIVLDMRKKKSLPFANAADDEAAFNDTSNWGKDAWPEDASSEAAWNADGGNVANAWGASDAWPAVEAVAASDSWGAEPKGVTSVAKFRVLYAFEARNPDELSIMPGDLVTVFVGQASEPGWLSGELKGKTGWFPESYVERLDAGNGADAAAEGEGSSQSLTGLQETVHIVGTEMKMTLSGIQEAPESISDSGSIGGEVASSEPQVSAFTHVLKSVSTALTASPIPGQGQTVEGLLAQAQFPWRAKKENHLTFSKGDIITIREQQDIWWFGELEGRQGWFPKSYVKLVSGPRNHAGEMSVELLECQRDFDGGQYYVAMYTYQSAEAGDLMFNQGDVILVTKSEGEWWTGSIDDRSGIFPSNYVKIMEQNDLPLDTDVPPPEPEEEAPGFPDLKRNSSETPDTPKSKGGKKPEIAIVIAPYTPTGSEQLGLQKGQLISIRKKNPSGWWEGELHAKGKKRQMGWFPASYVKLMSSDSSARSTPDPTHSRDEKETKDLVIALYPYNAQNEDELSFEKDSVINVVSKEDNAWWKGEFNDCVGVFPSNYVRHYDPYASSDSNTTTLPNSLSNATLVEKTRQGYIHELITTEESYMADMDIVLDAFYKPLKAAKVLTDQELDVIFVNWTELIKCNVKLLKALRVRRKMSKSGMIQMIGDILCENLPHMSPYVRFCSCQLNAAAIIQNKTENSQEFRNVTKKCQADPRTKGMPVSSFLLKPMQRITRYPLTIKKILENTLESHPDYGNLQEALGRAEELCSQVNEGVRERENSDRLEWLQRCVNCDSLAEKLIFNSVTNILGSRKFVHCGTLIKVKSSKELTGFLFNDFLLLTQFLKTNLGGSSSFRPKAGIIDVTSTAQFKVYRKPIFLNEIMVEASEEVSGSDNNGTHLQVRHIEQTYCFKAVSVTEKNIWLRKLESASKNYLEVERRRNERNQSFKVQQRPVLGRLLVVVLEGVDMKAKANVRRRAPKGILKIIIMDGSRLILNKGKGRCDPYCEVSMGSQEHKTKVVNDTVNPKWNASMQFKIKDTEEDVLCITVFDRDYFSPNDFLGRTEIRVADILKETRKTTGPIIMKKFLHEVETGEIMVKLDLQLFHK